MQLKVYQVYLDNINIKQYSSSYLNKVDARTQCNPVKYTSRVVFICTDIPSTQHLILLMCSFRCGGSLYRCRLPKGNNNIRTA